MRKMKRGFQVVALPCNQPHSMAHVKALTFLALEF